MLQKQSRTHCFSLFKSLPTLPYTVIKSKITLVSGQLTYQLGGNEGYSTNNFAKMRGGREVAVSHFLPAHRDRL